MADTTWLLLAYKVPSAPAAPRVALWRRLKSLGAVYVQSGVCMVPKSTDAVRELKTIEHEISRMEGESLLLAATALDLIQSEKIIARFNAERDDHYREFIARCDAFEAVLAKDFRRNKFTTAELADESVDLEKLRAAYERIRKLDHYRAPAAAEAGRRLKTCEELLETYARRVHEAHSEDGSLH